MSQSQGQVKPSPSGCFLFEQIVFNTSDLLKDSSDGTGFNLQKIMFFSSQMPQICSKLARPDENLTKFWPPA